MRSALVARSWFLALAVTVMGGAAEAADADTIVLSATGSEGARVRGQCVLRRVGGSQVVEISEAVPFERRWEGVGLRGELEAQGQVTVGAVRDGSRSRASVSRGWMTMEAR